MKMTVNTPPHPTTTQTPGASDEHLLTTTKHNMISNNNKKHNNNISGGVTKKTRKFGTMFQIGFTLPHRTLEIFLNFRHFGKMLPPHIRHF